MNTDAIAPEALAKVPAMVRGRADQLGERKKDEAFMLLEFLDQIMGWADNGWYAADRPWEKLAYEKRLVINQAVASDVVHLAQRPTLSLAHEQITLLEGRNMEGTVFTVRRKHRKVEAVENVPENDFFLKFMHVSKATAKDDIMELVISLALTLRGTPNVAQLYNWFVVDFGHEAVGDFTEDMRPDEMHAVRKRVAKSHGLAYNPDDNERVSGFIEGGKVFAKETWRLWFRRKINPFFTLVLITQNSGDIELAEMYSGEPKVLKPNLKRANAQLNTYWAGLLGKIYAKPTSDGRPNTIDIEQIRLKSTVAYMMHVLEKFQDIPRAIKAVHYDMHSGNVRSQRVETYGSAARSITKAPYTMLQKDKSTDWINWADLDSQEYTLIDFGHAQITLDFAKTAFFVNQMSVERANVAVRGLDSLFNKKIPSRDHNRELHVWFDVFRFAFFMSSAVLQSASQYVYDNYKEKRFNMANYRLFMQDRCTPRTLSFVMAAMTPPRLWFHYWSKYKQAKTQDMRHFGRATFGIEIILVYLSTMKSALLGKDDSRNQILSSVSVIERLFDSKDNHVSAYDAVNTYFNTSLNQLVLFSIDLHPANERDLTKRDDLTAMQTEFYKYNSPKQVRQWSWFVEDDLV